MLGRGTNGQVLAATNPFYPGVALKKGDLNNNKTEGRLLQQVHHTNVVQRFQILVGPVSCTLLVVHLLATLPWRGLGLPLLSCWLPTKGKAYNSLANADHLLRC